MPLKYHQQKIEFWKKKTSKLVGHLTRQWNCFFSLKVSVIFQNTKVRATIDWVLEKSIETIWTPDSTFRRLLARPSVGQAGGQTNYTGGSQKAFADTNTIINVECKHKCKQLLLRQIFSSSWKCSIQLTFISLNECLWVYGAENPQIAQKQNHKPNTNLHLRTF